MTSESTWRRSSRRRIRSSESRATRSPPRRRRGPASPARRRAESTPAHAPRQSTSSALGRAAPREPDAPTPPQPRATPRGPALPQQTPVATVQRTPASEPRASRKLLNDCVVGTVLGQTLNAAGPDGKGHAVMAFRFISVSLEERARSSRGSTGSLRKSIGSLQGTTGIAGKVDRRAARVDEVVTKVDGVAARFDRDRWEGRSPRCEVGRGGHESRSGRCKVRSGSRRMSIRSPQGSIGVVAKVDRVAARFDRDRDESRSVRCKVRSARHESRSGAIPSRLVTDAVQSCTARIDLLSDAIQSRAALHRMSNGVYIHPGQSTLTLTSTSTSPSMCPRRMWTLSNESGKTSAGRN